VRYMLDYFPQRIHGYHPLSEGGIAVSVCVSVCLSVCLSTCMFYDNHRRQLLEMTVGASFPTPFLPLSPYSSTLFFPSCLSSISPTPSFPVPLL